MKDKKLGYVVFLLIALFVLASCSRKSAVKQELKDPKFANVSVHDPAIIKSENKFYIAGSHDQLADSTDLIHWNQISSSVNEDILFNNIKEELASDFSYAQSDTLWAPNITQLKNGKYYLYYCLCKGDRPLSALGVAAADKVTGPYKKIKTILYSGTSPQFGETYDATSMPNAVDPDVFYDNDGNLWMVYGSYSGGIFILSMDDETGLPKENQGYGKHLIGGNHARIEAPYIQYNPKTKYYYLFTSFGGLDADGGYNIRVMRSTKPDGPYEDMEGQLADEIKGKYGATFDDASIEQFGEKIIGNFNYQKDDGLTNAGYVSPGHNSVYYDSKTNRYFLIFHTRFLNGGENHEVRVHEMVFTDNGWPVVFPLRYANEKIDNYTVNHVIGEYTQINFSKEISNEVQENKQVELKSDGTIVGDVKGSFRLSPKNRQHDSIVKINGTEYRGKFISQWDENQESQVMSFTGISSKGVPIFLIEKI